MMNMIEKDATNSGAREQNLIPGNAEKIVDAMIGLIGIYIQIYIYTHHVYIHHECHITHTHTHTHTSYIYIHMHMYMYVCIYT